MTYPTDAADAVQSRTGAAAGTLDRILMGVCVAVWLAALGTAVAATVALTDLGRPAPQTSGADTPWLLYAVIGVSAVVIAGAIPLLLRARRSAQTEPAPVPLTRERTTAPVGEPATEKMRVAGSAAPLPASLPPGYPTAAVDQLWLRSVLLIVTAMGVATIAIGAATYSMAAENDTVAWILYGLAAVVTLAMPVAAWWYLRRLRELLEPAV
jgi:hypothetical protein